MNTPDTQPQGETRTLAQQIRACADAVTTAALLDRRHIVAATLRDLADRAAETEQERDRQWQLKETAQGEIASARLRAEHIKRYTDALTTAADNATPAHIVGALQHHTAQLLRLLGTGSAQDGPERNAAGRAAVDASNAALLNAEGFTDALATARAAVGIPVPRCGHEPWLWVGDVCMACGPQKPASAEAAPACPDCEMPETNCCCG